MSMSPHSPILNIDMPLSLHFTIAIETHHGLQTRLRIILLSGNLALCLMNISHILWYIIRLITVQLVYDSMSEITSLPRKTYRSARIDTTDSASSHTVFTLTDSALIRSCANLGRWKAHGLYGVV